MSHFLRHEGCKGCGSRDNFARYSDGGGFCFGCRYRERSNGRPPDHRKPVASIVDEDCQPLPDDVCCEYTTEMMAWVGKYGIEARELVARDVVCSPRRRQLIFKFLQNKQIVVWQSRNFWEQARSKATTHGDMNGHLLVYNCIPSGVRLGVLPELVDGTLGGRRVDGSPDNRSTVDGGSSTVRTTDVPVPARKLVIVEDPISAIKVARQCDAMPLLGSTIPVSKVNALAGLYSSVRVWLDPDKLDNAMKIADLFNMVGTDVGLIRTDLDPKEYDDVAIQGWLGTGGEVRR